MEEASERSKTEGKGHEPKTDESKSLPMSVEPVQPVETAPKVTDSTATQTGTKEINTNADPTPLVVTTSSASAATTTASSSPVKSLSPVSLNLVPSPSNGNKRKHTSPSQSTTTGPTMLQQLDATTLTSLAAVANKACKNSASDTPSTRRDATAPTVPASATSASATAASTAAAAADPNPPRPGASKLVEAVVAPLLQSLSSSSALSSSALPSSSLPPTAGASVTWSPYEQTVHRMVHEMMALLQTRGPLTVAQMVQSLPPFWPSPEQQQAKDGAATTASTDAMRSAAATIPFGPTSWSAVPTSSETATPATKAVPLDVPNTLTSNSEVVDILELLVALGVVQQLPESPDAATLSNPSVDGTRYVCTGGGVPRALVVTPTTILSEIKAAQDEIRDSQARCEVLREAIRGRMDDSGAPPTEPKTDIVSPTVSVRVVLKKLALAYPQLRQDPVYYTAFRQCQVHVWDTEPPAPQAAPPVAAATAAAEPKKS
jgi:hypothetical protein